MKVSLCVSQQRKIRAGTGRVNYLNKRSETATANIYLRMIDVSLHGNNLVTVK